MIVCWLIFVKSQPARSPPARCSTFPPIALAPLSLTLARGCLEGWSGPVIARALRRPADVQAAPADLAALPHHVAADRPRPGVRDLDALPGAPLHLGNQLGQL